MTSENKYSKTCNSSHPHITVTLKYHQEILLYIDTGYSGHLYNAVSGH